MKKIFLVLILIIVSSASYAGAELTSEQKNEFCSTLGKTAGNIMEARQKDAPLSKLMKFTEDNTKVSVSAQKIIKQLIFDAYEISSYSTKESQDSAVEKFKNKVMLECYKSIED